VEPTNRSKAGCWFEGVLTVAVLVEQLQQMPPNMQVIAEGCDCHGAVQRVRLAQIDWDDEHAVVLLETYA
jgi:hypothetical protein